MPQGKIVALDLHDCQPSQDPLFSRRYRLTGKPDYLIRLGKEWIPVEVKSGNGFQQPYEAHVFQLLAYCLLIEEHYGVRPRYGYLHYLSRTAQHNRGVTYQIEFNEEVREKLIDLLNQMQHLEQYGDVPRSHQEMARCRSCGYASICDQRL